MLLFEHKFCFILCITSCPSLFLQPPLYTYRYVPVPGLYWADAVSIGPVQARYWQLMACLQGRCMHGDSFSWALNLNSIFEWDQIPISLKPDIVYMWLKFRRTISPVRTNLPVWIFPQDCMTFVRGTCVTLSKLNGGDNPYFVTQIWVVSTVPFWQRANVIHNLVETSTPASWFAPVTMHCSNYTNVFINLIYTSVQSLKPL